MAKKYTTTVTMRPVCECGYTFEELHYNNRNKRFAPHICPNCKRTIETFTFDDLTKRTPNADGDICICEQKGDWL